MMLGFLRRFSLPTAALLLAAFLSGFAAHLLYGRWSGAAPCPENGPCHFTSRLDPDSLPGLDPDSLPVRKRRGKETR